MDYFGTNDRSYYTSSYKAGILNTFLWVGLSYQVIIGQYYKHVTIVNDNSRVIGK